MLEGETNTHPDENIVKMSATVDNGTGTRFEDPLCTPEKGPMGPNGREDKKLMGTGSPSRKKTSIKSIYITMAILEAGKGIVAKSRSDIASSGAEQCHSIQTQAQKGNRKFP